MDFDEVVVKESPGLCRCCLSEGCYKELGTEYSWMSETEIYADMLLECFDVSISQQMEGPNGPNRLICEVCITRLRDACNFKKQVLESEKKFIDMVAKGEFRTKVMLYEQDNMKEEPQIVQADALEVEYLDELDFGDDAEDLLKDDDTDHTQTEDITVAPLPVKRGRGRPRKNPISVKPEKKSKIAKLEEKPRSSKSSNKGAKTNTADKCSKLEMMHKLTIKQRNIEYILQYGNVTPFLWHKGKFKCFYCSEPMKDVEYLREHTVKMHQFADIERVVHDRTMNNRNKDAAIKIDVKGLSCRLCTQNISDLEQLIHHLIITHDAEYDTSVTNCFLPFLLDKDNPTCATCHMKFAFFEYLLRHANKNHLSHNYICDVCGTSFQGENHLMMHHRYYHRDGGYSCEYCDANLTTLSQKILHEKNVHLINLSKCPQCPETFKSKYLKKLHLANVHGVEEMRIKCPYCPKVYPQVGIMSRHMRRVHLREKNVECQVCGDKFFSSYDLKLHMVRHNGDKKFVCDVCGKKFSKKSNLNVHAFKHDKTYSCQICGKSFMYQSNLKSHFKSCHAEYQIIEQADELVDSEIVQIEFVKDPKIIEFVNQ